MYAFVKPGYHLNKEEGKDQKSTQSMTTPRTSYGKVTKHMRTSHTGEPRGQPFPSR